jgi:segregation and condensation protein B
MEDLKRIMEALLFASPEPLSVARIKSILQGVEIEEVTQALESLKDEYAQESRSFQMVEIGGGYQLATKPDYAVFVGNLVESRTRQRLSKAAMETLAVVAYKQPVVRSTVEGIRGVNADGVLRTLMERDLVRIVGRGDGPGRPLLFGTTREFLLQFGLNKLSDLPGMKEIEELVGGKDEGGPPAEEDMEEPGPGEGPASCKETDAEADVPTEPADPIDIEESGSEVGSRTGDAETSCGCEACSEPAHEDDSAGGHGPGPDETIGAETDVEDCKD